MRDSARELSPRDMSIVRLTARFKQLTASHINELLFTNTTTRTPTDRALRRLVDGGYLVRVERRIPGGARGGSGQYVYALGSKGYYMFFSGSYSPPRSVRYHTLAITELYVAMRRLETSGAIKIMGLATEPDCHVTIGRWELKPDMYIELEVGGRRRRLFIEVDMGTEGQKQLRGKLDVVVRALRDADSSEWPVFPKTIWVCVDQERETELRWLIEQMHLSEEDQRLFKVCRLETVAAALGLSSPQA